MFSKKPNTDKKASVKKETKKPVKVVAESPKKTSVSKPFDAGIVIRNPRITEKAAHVSDNAVYTFDVFPRATKTDIMKAIKSVYGVTPIKVNVTSIPTKRVFRQKFFGTKGGGRKAYVFLKKGDKIEFI